MELKMARSDYIGIFVVISRSKGKLNITHFCSQKRVIIISFLGLGVEV